MTASPQIIIMGDTITQNDPRISKVARSLHNVGFSLVSVGINQKDQLLEEFPWKHISVSPYAAYDNTESLDRVSILNKVLASVLSYIACLVKLFHSETANIVSKAAKRSLRGQSVIFRAKYYWQLRWGLRLLQKNYTRVYWESNPVYDQIFQAIANQVESCELWIANDWDMLPIAQRLQAKFGGKIWYDSHEFATDEFSGQIAFRKWKQPLVRAVESDLIKICDRVSTVSSGLCDALQSLYGLKETPLCLRNIPPYVHMPYRPCSGTIDVLYQGIVAPGRGLESLIESTLFWDNNKTLTIRGPVASEVYKVFIENLIQKVSQNSEHSVAISVVPPVPFTDLITAAAKFDVGVMALPQNSVHQRFALPNKIFEYMMAGLAILISDSRDMRDVVEKSDCGDVFTDLAPDTIAAVINKMTAERVNLMKQAALRSVKTLNWESEFEKMRASVNALLE